MTHKHFAIHLLTASAAALTISSIISTSPARAQTPGIQEDSIGEQIYNFLYNQVKPTQAPAVYPDPSTGQPQPWQPQNNMPYGYSGVRG